jgi:hypothetical protein
MTYQSRITVDPVYLQAVGQAFYNFTYLEWIIIWTIVRLSSNGFESVPKGQPASVIAKALTHAIQGTQPPLSASLRQSLVKLDENYRAAIKTRNKLLHAHPHTAPDGSQQLSGGGYIWPIDEVNEAAKLFEDIALLGSELFHGGLTQERP